MAEKSAKALIELHRQKIGVNQIVTDAAVRNAMVVHAAFGGSTNLLLHVPAIAHAAGLRRPVCEDWINVNRRGPRVVGGLPHRAGGDGEGWGFLPGGGTGGKFAPRKPRAV